MHNERVGKPTQAHNLRCSKQIEAVAMWLFQKLSRQQKMDLLFFVRSLHQQQERKKILSSVFIGRCVSLSISIFIEHLGNLYGCLYIVCTLALCTSRICQ